MIHISRQTLIKTSILIVFIIFLLFTIGYNFYSERETKIVETHNQDKEVPHDTSNGEEINETEEEVLHKEDPVGDFLKEKIDKATTLLFTRDLQIVTLGDSLTEGIGDETNGGGYVGILERNMNQDMYEVKIDNFGKRGRRTTHLLKLLEEKEIVDSLENADVILITIGANDIMQVFKENFTKLTLEKFEQEQIQYENRLHDIFSKIKNINGEADIFLIGFYNPFHQYFSYIEELDLIVNNWNEVGLRVTKQYEHAHFIPLKDLFDDAPVNYFADDHFHPNHLGYQVIAERVLQYMSNVGENHVEMESAGG